MGQGSRRSRVALLGALVLLLAFPASARAVSPSFFGISAFENPTQAEFDRMRAAGIGSFRMPVEWRGVQPQQNGPFTFAAYDALVGGAARAGLQVVPLLYGSPGYISSHMDDPPVDTRDQRRQYSRFVRAIVQRYGAGGSFWAENPAIPSLPVRWWIAWNEPNLKAWWYPRPQPKRYVRLLRLTSAKIRAADPTARIVTAGIYRLPARRAGQPMTRYLRALYRSRGFKRAADAVAIHIFAPKPRQVLKTAREARAIMNRARDRRTPLWINELAWATAGDAPIFRTTEQGQARRLARTYRLLLKNRKRLRLHRVYWLAFRDQAGSPNSWIQYTGLNDYAGRPKPAWSSLAQLAGGVP